MIDEHGQLEDEINGHETDVEALEDHDRSELLERHKEANQLEFELGRLENDPEDITDETEAPSEMNGHGRCASDARFHGGWVAGQCVAIVSAVIPSARGSYWRIRLGIR